MKGHQRQLADEIDAAPATAVLPDVALAYVNVTDQLKAAHCEPVN